MLCQNVNPGRKVQWEYVTHAVAILNSTGYSWGYYCFASVENKY